MKKLLLFLLIAGPVSAFAQISYTVDVLRLKAKADDCDGGAITFCSAAPQDPVFHVWTLDAGANENTYCWIFDNDPAAAYNVWADIQNVEIANETNVLTTYIQIDMGGFESDALGGIDCSDWSGDNVLNRQLAQQFDLSFIPEGTPFTTIVSIGDIYYAEIQILWIDLTAGTTPLTNDIDFSVVPNPTNGLFHINIDNQIIESYSVSVTDISGRMVFENNNMVNQTEIDLSTQETGTYFVTVEYNGVHRTKKIVKQ